MVECTLRLSDSTSPKNGAFKIAQERFHDPIAGDVNRRVLEPTMMTTSMKMRERMLLSQARKFPR
ncbi:uncharacterized protein LOC117192499 isoform X2 [Drosophila miranda]|uniref:uncharacterized protein LOC117192499 isoform X2 n=1 Tax=Drosophila miranda TaxID=7229 RepID=UPI00143F1EB2|nr:uncharacterized protein LOC117192499 isoform X2 [Drosophila miranda]